MQRCSLRLTFSGVCLLVALLAGGGCATKHTAMTHEPGGVQTVQTFTPPSGSPFSGKFWLYLPEGYSREGNPWPLMLFLHGAGERGDDLERVKVHGPPKLVDQGKSLPFLIVSPQAPEDHWWSTDYLVALLDAVEKAYHVDPDRIYVTGLSMGGFGTWDLAVAQPDRFAAIAPICGGGDPEAVCAIRHVPVWVFHGAKDTVVPISRSEEMVEALKACGGQVRFTVYPEAGHDAWTVTYDNPEFYAWLLSQRRTRSK